MKNSSLTESPSDISRRGIDSDWRTESRLNSIRTDSTGGIPQKFVKHRKSSIPFSDRFPKVRFLRLVEPHGEDDRGNHLPIPKDSKAILFEKSLQPILKKSDFPILVDVHLLEPDSAPNFNDFEDKATNLTTNEVLESCANNVEQIVQIFSRAERQARGAIDILTFPVASGSLEPLARFEGNLVVAILSVEKVPSVINENSMFPSQVSPLTGVIELTEQLLEDIRITQHHASHLKKKAKLRHQQWKSLLSRKGDFRIEDNPTQTPIYSQKRMPESVTLYEDVLDEDRRYRFDGSTRIYRYSNDIMLFIDADLGQFQPDLDYPEEVNHQQLVVISETALDNAKELVLYAQKQILMAIETISENQLMEKGFNCIKDKILHLEFDAFFDPLCALELKNSLGDVVRRKGELLNTSEHTVNFLIMMEKCTKLFLKYSLQVSKEIMTKRPTPERCFGCSKPVTKQSCLETLPGLGNKDFMISIPLTKKFQSVVSVKH
jgi:hypothetical protein